MAIAAGIKNLELRQLFALTGVLLSRPLFIIPTFKATKETIKISTSLFGKEHHSNNRTNAFRHALWNFLICEKCNRVGNSKEKVLFWSKRITDLHERLSPNDEPEKSMDLHNNKVGRLLFEKNIADSSQVTSLLKEKMKSAIKIRTIADIKEAGDHLVFIEK